MNTIREYAAPIAWTEQATNPGDVEYIQELSGLHYYMIGQSDYDGGGRLIGRWDLDGEPLQTPDPKYIELLALGNIGGLAHTPGVVNWQGRGQRLVQDPGSAVGLPEYPADQQPFDIEIRRYQRVVNEVTEWAWRGELHKNNVAPLDRAVAMYGDAAFTQYEGTTGGFVQVESLWQTNDDGTPATVWGADCPFGFGTPEPVELYLALWRSQFISGLIIPFGAKGRGVFWEFEQGGGGGEYVDVGVTVDNQFGTVIVASDMSLFDVGTKVRILGIEYVVLSFWPDNQTKTGMNLDPTAPVIPLGTTIEIWQ